MDNNHMDDSKKLMEQRERFLETSRRAEKDPEPFELQGSNPNC
jgi:hypothetical protein